LVGSEKQRQPNTKRIRSNNHTATVLAAAVRQYPGLQAGNTHAAQSSKAGTGTKSRTENREQSRPEGRAEDLEVNSAIPVAEPMEDILEDAPMDIDPPVKIAPQSQITQVPALHFTSWSLGGAARKQRHCSICRESDCIGRNNKKRCPYFKVCYIILWLIELLMIPITVCNKQGITCIHTNSAYCAPNF
jgi:hypothetical protein